MAAKKTTGRKSTAKRTRKTTAAKRKATKKAATGAKKATKKATKAVKKSAARATSAVKRAAKNPKRTVREAASNVHETADRARGVAETMVRAGEAVRQAADFVDSVAQSANARVNSRRKKSR